METKLEIFNHDQFGELSAFNIDGEPWFVANEIADKMGYKYPVNAIQVHCEESKPLKDLLGKNADLSQLVRLGVTPTLEISNLLRTNMIPESDMYSLIMGSQLAGAKAFKTWVVKEVLPSIRKHGAYMTKDTLEKAIMDRGFIVSLLSTLADTQGQRDQEKGIEAEKKVAEVETEVN